MHYGKPQRPAAFQLTKLHAEKIGMLDQVKAIAQDVHNWTRARAERANYNPFDLCGWCAIASGELHKRLERAGIASEIHLSSTGWGTHAYVVAEDHVIDVTALQFGIEENVFVMHHKEAEAMPALFYKSFRTFANAKELRKFQLSERWPAHQHAYA